MLPVAPEASLITDQKSLRGALREKFPREHGQLLPALHFLQHEFGYLPDWGMEVVGWHLGIPASEVYGAATSYTELRVEQPGAHVLRVCTGLSCWQNGGAEILAEAASELGAHPGQTTADGRFTFEETPCGYLCGLAPVVALDGAWLGRVTPDSVVRAIGEALEK